MEINFKYKSYKYDFINSFKDFIKDNIDFSIDYINLLFHYFTLYKKDEDDFKTKLMYIFQKSICIDTLVLPYKYFDNDIIFTNNINNIFINCHDKISIANLPTNLKGLSLKNCNINILDNLPKNLKTLELIDIHNLSYINIPENLEYLYFNSYYTGSDIILPPNLKHFQLPYNNNQFIIKFHPNTTKISFEDEYHKYNNKNSVNLHVFGSILDKLYNLPTNLKSLFFNGEYNFPLDNLPENLEFLHIDKYNFDLNSLPLNLKTLSINTVDKPLNNLPCNLENLIIEHCDCSLDNLPNNLVSLNISYCNSKLNFIPNNLKILEINRFYYDSLDNLPPNLEELIIPYEYNETITFIPDTLKKVTITYDCDNREIYIKLFNDALGDKCKVIIENYNNY